MKLNSLTLEITSHCQANCIVCVRDKIKFSLGNMSQEIFEKAIEEAYEFYPNILSESDRV